MITLDPLTELEFSTLYELIMEHNKRLKSNKNYDIYRSLVEKIKKLVIK